MPESTFVRYLPSSSLIKSAPFSDTAYVVLMMLPDCVRVRTNLSLMQADFCMGTYHMAWKHGCVHDPQIVDCLDLQSIVDDLAH